MNNNEYKSLEEVLDIIKNAFDDFISYQTFIVEVEVSKIKQYKQFFYVDLVQIKDWKIIETAKSNIFNPLVMSSFLSEVGISINDLAGKKILLTLRPSFHKTYGFSFNILKIHSDYFLWSLEKSKKENIYKLQKLWIFENNKKLSLWFPNFHIAVITWRESEGFRDFMTILEESWYNITYDVYTSLVHWEKASKEVLKSLSNIDTNNYNLIAIIRWWWGSEGMNWTNDFELSKFICESNIPIMTAVGHTVDKNIIDMVSRYDCKTPSEAANILIWFYESYENELKELTNFIDKNIKAIIKEYSIVLWHLSDNIKVSIRWRFKTYLLKIDSYNIIYEYIKNHFRNIKVKLDTFNSIIRNNNPSKIMSRWYNLVYDKKWKLQTEYEVWEKYILSANNYNYKIEVCDKKKKK